MLHAAATQGQWPRVRAHRAVPPRADGACGATCMRIPSSASRRSTPPPGCRRRCELCGVDEVHTGIGKTGVVGVIQGQQHGSGRMIGLRADMDALPMHEDNDFAWKSAHDGHDARLRPRRPHGDAGRRGALPGRDAQLRRHRRPDLPAGRGRLRRRQGDDRGRPVRALPGRSGLRACTTGRPCKPGTVGINAGADDGRGRPRRRSRSRGKGGHGAHAYLAVDPVLVAGAHHHGGADHRLAQRAARSTAR